MLDLDIVAVRVLGALIEKEITTPDNYPLTLNALVAACNQTSNRDPVLTLDEQTVLASIQDLMRRSLVKSVQRSGSRVKRYRQAFSESMSLHEAETAIMCVLMLRGAQTSGEIRTRTTRLFEFIDLEHVDVTLRSLMDLSEPLVVELPRQPGQKEARYMHLLSGEPEVAPAAPTVVQAKEPTASNDRVEKLEEDVDALRSELADLRARFEEFVRQFQ